MGWIWHPDCRATVNAEASRSDEIRIGDRLPACAFRAGNVVCGNVIEMTSSGLCGNDEGGFGCLYLDAHFGAAAERDEIEEVLEPLPEEFL